MLGQQVDYEQLSQAMQLPASVSQDWEGPGPKQMPKLGIQWPFGKERLNSHLGASSAQNERIRMFITYLIPGH